MNLHPTRVNKLDSCLTYALKRTGNATSIYQLSKDIPATAYKPFSIDHIHIGQILVWQSAKNHYLWATEIITTDTGKPAIVMNNEFAGMHFGVIEAIDHKESGEIIITISDCVRSSNAHSFPTISLATICLRDEAKSKTEVRLPTYYLEL